MTRPVAILLAVTLAGCGRDPAEKVEPWQVMRLSRPPPGFAIMCNNEGKYAPAFDCGNYQSTFWSCPDGFDARTSAVATAWNYYEWDRKQDARRAAREWHECE